MYDNPGSNGRGGEGIAASMGDMAQSLAQEADELVHMLAELDRRMFASAPLINPGPPAGAHAEPRPAIAGYLQNIRFALTEARNRAASLLAQV